MRGSRGSLAGAAGLLLLAGGLIAGGPFEESEYAARRARLMERIVFSCDIQLFRLAEEIGIRIEDTVAEIKTLMRTDGVLQVLRDRGLVRGE